MKLRAATDWWRAFRGPSDIRVRWRRAFRAAFLLCAPFIVLYTAFRLLGVRINLTSSLERGFYIVSRTPSANLVEFCPEGEAATISLQRGYRTPGGTCPDGGSPLMKPIAAVAGDHVEVTTYGIRVNSKLIANSAAHFKDHRGRKLNPWPNGDYIVPTGSLWVISDFNSWSFDSRYFGPIRSSIVQHRLRPLWTLPTKVPEP
jgi:conjugative transfer signal peptidase TraF